MAENSKIEWTDNTLNFWWGCMKVSPGCQHCYAETFSKRVGRNIWGPAATTERWRTKGPWRDVLKWDKAAKSEGIRRKVFCQSMSDFFEDHPQLYSWRAEAVEILESLEWLDVQLLTKRPENIRLMVPDGWMKVWPTHIWVGTSVENQEQADKRIPELLKVPAKIKFLSCEPLLGPVDLGFPFVSDNPYMIEDHVDWVIVGGESGHGARPMQPIWAQSLRDQCNAAGVAFHFKQWGEYIAKPSPRGEIQLYKVGKHEAGRLLDGRTWDQFPDA